MGRRRRLLTLTSTSTEREREAPTRRRPRLPLRLPPLPSSTSQPPTFARGLACELRPRFGRAPPQTPRGVACEAAASGAVSMCRVLSVAECQRWALSRPSGLGVVGRYEIRRTEHTMSQEWRLYVCTRYAVRSGDVARAAALSRERGPTWAVRYAWAMGSQPAGSLLRTHCSLIHTTQ